MDTDDPHILSHGQHVLKQGNRQAVVDAFPSFNFFLGTSVRLIHSFSDDRLMLDVSMNMNNIRQEQLQFTESATRQEY